MEFASIIPNFFNILAGAWYNTVFDGLFLFLDGVIFSLVSLAFDVFIMTCQINFDALYAVIAPLLDRIEAVIMVLVVFKLGISFIGYMIEPEKAPAEGRKLIINIFITAALLLSYNFIFSVFNDISMLLLGAPENYPYTTLSNIADIQPGEKDEGLIMRFIFGKNDAIKNSNIGDFMAYQTLNIFLRETTSNKSLADELDPGGDGNYEFRNISNLSDEVGKTFDYMPLIGTVIGLFLIYSIVKVSIEIGIRMFKMLILQILAPVAIITCIDGGVKSKTFSTYYKTFLGVFVQVFVRVFVMYVITVFACKFFLSIGDFVNDLPNAGIKKYLVAIVIIVAGFKMVNDIPKFIDEALGTKIAGADNKGGFGNFLGGLIGGGIGAVTGFAAGIGAGNASAAISGIFSGAVTGGINGSKGNTIADKFKSIGTTTKSNRARAGNIAAAGGLLPMAWGGIQSAVGVGRMQDRQLADLDAQSKLIEEFEQAQIDEIKDKKMTSIESGGHYAKGFDQVEFGSDKSAYAEKMLEYDNEYILAKSNLEKAKQGGVSGTIAGAQRKLLEARDASIERSKKIYEDKQKAASGENVTVKKKKMERVLGEGAANQLKSHKTRIKDKKNEILNKNSYERTHRSSGDGK